MAQSVAKIIPVFPLRYGHVNCFYSLTCLVWISVVCSQQPSILISDTDITLKEGDTFSILCSVQNPIPHGELIWIHIENVYNVMTAGQMPRVTVSEFENAALQTSSLSISDVSVDDSGNITCRYLNPSHPDGVAIILEQDVAVCVSQHPKSPTCFLAMEDILCLSPAGICPNDITLQWFDMNSMQELNGTITRKGGMIENIFKIDHSINAFLCIMESKLFPDISLNCSISISPPHRTTTPPNTTSSVSYPTSTSWTPTTNNVTNVRSIEPSNSTTSSLSSSATIPSLASTATTLTYTYSSILRNSADTTFHETFPSTASTITSTEVDSSGAGTATDANVLTPNTTNMITYSIRTAKSNNPITRTLVIAAALAGAGGMLVILFAAIGIYFACKRCTKNTPGGNLDIDFELATRKFFPEIEEDTRANVSAMRLSKREKENEQTETNGVLLSANPDTDNTILNGLSNPSFTPKSDLESTNLYASVRDISNEDNDPQKIDPSVKEDHAYAYPDIVKDASRTNENNSSIFDSQPTESEEDSQEEQEISSDPHYFTLEKEIEAEDVLKRRESMPIYAKPDKRQNERRESMPIYAKPDKIKK